jgi:diketogulonate reductase-like aldo/keto reductase
VLEAIEAGYRHIDTAQAYGNEAGVGAAIKKTTVPREELFLTTKLAAEIKEYDGAVKAIDDSLKKLGVDVIDLMIIHSPKPWAEFHGEEHYFEGNLAAWRALEEAYQAGELRAIGVSNFEIVDLENLLKHSKTKPAVNQVLAHIGQTPGHSCRSLFTHRPWCDAEKQDHHCLSGQIQGLHSAIGDSLLLTVGSVAITKNGKSSAHEEQRRGRFRNFR